MVHTVVVDRTSFHKEFSISVAAIRRFQNYKRPQLTDLPQLSYPALLIKQYSGKAVQIFLLLFFFKFSV